MVCGWVVALMAGFAMAVGLQTPAGATTFVEMDPTALTLASQVVVVGVVREVRVLDGPGGGVTTRVAIAPTEILSGSVAGDIVLEEPGGRLGNREERVYGSPVYMPGEEVVVFARAGRGGTLHTTALAMGKYHVERTETGPATATRSFGAGTSVLRPGRRGLLAAPPAPGLLLNDLRARVLATTVAGVGAFGADEALRNPPVLPAVRNAFVFLGTASRWFEPDQGQAVRYGIDPRGAAGIGPDDSRGAVREAFAAWSGVNGSSLVLADGGSTEAVGFRGCGANRVVFDDPAGELDDPVKCGGVLALGGFCASGETRTVAGTTFRRITSGKLVFNNGWSGCQVWNRCNLAEVATHELGHTIGFGHSDDSRATMAAQAHFDGRCAGLKGDDRNALLAAYPATGVATPRATRPGTATPTRTRRPADTPTPVPTWTAPPTATRPPTRAATLSPTPTATRTRASTPTRTGNGLRLGGHIYTENSRRPVPGLNIDLSGGYLDRSWTDDDGWYEFSDVPAGSWTIRPVADEGTSDAISALDVAYVLEAVAGRRTLNRGQQLACDTTGNGTITTADATRLLDVVVGNRARVPAAVRCGSDWLFLPRPGSFRNNAASLPWFSTTECHLGSIRVDLSSGPVLDEDFSAVLLGDCTGNWTAKGHREPRAAVNSSAYLGRPRRVRRRLVRVPLVLRAAPFSGLDVEIDYDPALLRPGTVRAQGAAAGALVRARTGPGGVLRIAVAGEHPIAVGARPVLTVDFATTTHLPRRTMPPLGLRVFADEREVPTNEGFARRR